MQADVEPKEYLKRDLAVRKILLQIMLSSSQEALDALGSLQSNASVIESWRQTIHENKEASLANEMRNYLQRLDVHVRSVRFINFKATDRSPTESLARILSVSACHRYKRERINMCLYRKHPQTRVWPKDWLVHFSQPCTCAVSCDCTKLI